jgi:hypothetical protein
MLAVRIAAICLQIANHRSPVSIGLIFRLLLPASRRSGAEPDDWDVRAWAVGDVGHPGPISRLQRTVYGKILLDNCRAWLLDWKFVR